MESLTAGRKLTLLLCSILWELSGVRAQIQIPQTSVEVIKGQMVVLKAWYTPAPSNEFTANTVVWNIISPKPQSVISYTQGSISVGSPHFHERINFTANMPSNNISLYINNTQETDSGEYFCQVIIPQNDDLSGTLILDVKVPPAVPKCSLSGKPVLKGNVTLSCTSSAGKPVPLYKWKKTSPTSQVFFSPMLSEKNGTLKLSNLSSNMSGTYVCTASNSAGSQTCDINLNVVAPTNVGKIVGATVGSVVGVLVLLAIGVFFLLRRRRDSEDDMANEIKEDAQAPKRVSWARSGMGSDIISKNGTLSSIASSPHHKEASNHNNHHPHLQHYPQRPPSDTGSIITATGSTSGYRPSRQHGASTPTHYGYNSNATLPQGQTASSDTNTNDNSLPRTERYTQLPQAPQQTYSQPHFQLQATPSLSQPPTSSVTAANISRMGGVPIMVPVQNQAGSLV